MNVGLIRVVTLNNEKEINAYGSLIMKHYPEFNVISKCINDQPFGIYDEESKNKAIPKIIINDIIEFEGAVPEEFFLNKILEALKKSE